MLQVSTGSMAAPVQNSMTPVQNSAPSGVFNATKGVTYDIFQIPTSLVFTAQSNNAGGSGTKTIYIFNNGDTNGCLNNSVVDNGAGGGSIVNAYGDGFSGKVYNKLASNANAGRGILIIGFIVQVTNYTTGSQNSVPLNTLQFQLQNANSQGGLLPIPVNVQEAVNPTNQQVGTLIIASNFYLNGLNQVSVSLPNNTAYAFTFKTSAGTLS